MDLNEEVKQEIDCRHARILASSDGTCTCPDCRARLSEKKLREIIGIEGVEEIKKRITALKDLPEEAFQGLVIRETRNSKEIIAKRMEFRYVKDQHSIIIEVNKEDKVTITKRDVVFISIVLGGGILACIIFFLFYFLCPPFRFFIDWLFSGVDWDFFWRYLFC